MILSLNTKKIAVSLGLFVFLLPVLILAQGTGQVNNPASPQTTKTGITYDCAAEHPGTAPGECTFSDFIAAVIKITKYAALLALSFSIVVIAWAGFNYMISGSQPAKRAEANKMLLSVIKGIAFILLAWLIVTLITKGLLLKTGAGGINTFLGS